MHTQNKMKLHFRKNNFDISSFIILVNHIFEQIEIYLLKKKVYHTPPGKKIRNFTMF